jgi:hypothetical protein
MAHAAAELPELCGSHADRPNRGHGEAARATDGAALAVQPALTKSMTGLVTNRKHVSTRCVQTLPGPIPARGSPCSSALFPNS